MLVDNYFTISPISSSIQHHELLSLILALVEVSAETSIHEEANANSKVTEEINNIQNQNNEVNEENDNDDSIHSNLRRRELWPWTKYTIGWSSVYYSSTSATLSWECKASTKYDICWKKASQWSVLIAWHLSLTCCLFFDLSSYNRHLSHQLNCDRLRWGPACWFNKKSHTSNSQGSNCEYTIPTECNTKYVAKAARTSSDYISYSWTSRICEVGCSTPCPLGGTLVGNSITGYCAWMSPPDGAEAFIYDNKVRVRAVLSESELRIVNIDTMISTPLI